MLGEERGAELERRLVLSRVDGVPDRPHPPLRDSAGEPELAGHVSRPSRSRVRVLSGGRWSGWEREEEEGESRGGTARKGLAARAQGDPSGHVRGRSVARVRTVDGRMGGVGSSAV